MFPGFRFAPAFVDLAGMTLEVCSEFIRLHHRPVARLARIPPSVLRHPLSEVQSWSREDTQAYGCRVFLCLWHPAGFHSRKNREALLIVAHLGGRDPLSSRRKYCASPSDFNFNCAIQADASNKHRARMQLRRKLRAMLDFDGVTGRLSRSAGKLFQGCGQHCAGAHVIGRADCARGGRRWRPARHITLPKDC